MSIAQLIITILVIAVATFFTRSLAFIVFPEGRATPKYVRYLGTVLPCATISMLVVYCLKDVTPVAWPHGIPEIISLAVTALLQLWKRNTLLSIAAGLGLYMFLIRMMFAT